MLCWGVYRFKDSENSGVKFSRPSSKRYVICNPDADFRLLPTDLVYVLQQFDSKHSDRAAGFTHNPNHAQRSPKDKASVSKSESRSPFTNSPTIARDNSSYANLGNISKNIIYDDKYNLNFNKKYESPHMLWGNQMNETVLFIWTINISIFYFYFIYFELYFSWSSNYCV